MKASSFLQPRDHAAPTRTAAATRVTAVTIAANALLALGKLLIGILARSGAMVSDAVHTVSDVASSGIVIIGVRLASRASDADHPYGHERFECVAAMVLSVMLCVTGLFIGHTAIEQLRAHTAAVVPGLAALIMAVVSILAKEGMYRYTRTWANRLDSGALLADAWHHRSDALSSIGALVGIAGARMGFAGLDQAACLIICVFILKAAYDVFKDAVGKMVDHAGSEELVQAITQCAAAVPQVAGVGTVRSRLFGSRVYVELEILVDGALPLAQAHGIAAQVHDTIERRFDKIKHIAVLMKPSP